MDGYQHSGWPCLLNFYFTLKMKAGWSSEMLVSYNINTLCHNLEDHILNLHCHEHLKSCIKFIFRKYHDCPTFTGLQYQAQKSLTPCAHQCTPYIIIISSSFTTLSKTFSHIHSPPTYSYQCPLYLLQKNFSSWWQFSTHSLLQQCPFVTLVSNNVHSLLKPPIL